MDRHDSQQNLNSFLVERYVEKCQRVYKQMCYLPKDQIYPSQTQWPPNASTNSPINVA